MYEKYAKLRDEAGYSDYYVAKETGIPKSTFSEWKAKKYQPKADKLKLIADLFGVTVDFFIS